MYPTHADVGIPVPAAWRQELTHVFVWAAEHDPTYFTQLTWEQIRQEPGVRALLIAWVEEQISFGVPGMVQYGESLLTLGLLEQRSAGKIDQVDFVADLVDAIRPPWGDRPLTLALAEVDPALVEEFRQIEDVFVLADRLSDVLEQDYGFGWEIWFRTAERLCTEVVEGYLPQFLNDCTEHLRWYLPAEGGIRDPGHPEQGTAPQDGVVPPPVEAIPTPTAATGFLIRDLGYLDVDYFAPLFEDRPGLRARVDAYNDAVYEFNRAGEQRWRYRATVAEAVERVHDEYLDRQPTLVQYVEYFSRPPGNPDGLQVRQLRALLQRWEELRAAYEVVFTFVGPPEADPPPENPAG